MSINHFIFSEIEPKYDIYVNNIKLEQEGKIENAKVKVANNDIVDFSSLPSFGNGGQLLTSDGDGTISWTNPSGGSGVNYNGNVPTQIGKIAIYGAVNGELIKDSTLSDSDILNKNGDTMLGNLNMNNNNIDNVGNISINSDTISSTGFLEFVSGSTERINFKSDSGILSLENANVGNSVNIELAQFGGTNFNILKGTGNVDFCAESNDTVQITTDCFGTNKKVILDPVTSNVQLRDYDLDMNSNDIINVSNTTSGVINCLTINSTDVKTNRVFLTGTLDVTQNNINNVNILDVDNIQSSNPAINVNTPIDMNVNNIQRVGDLETSTISALTSSINMVNNVSLQNNNITSVGSITANVVDAQTTSTLVLNSGINPDLDVNTNLDLNTNNITNVGNLEVSSINSITPVGGLYSGISDGLVINQASGQSDLLPVSSVGSLNIPANGFQVGDAYHLVVAGTFPSENKGDDITIEIKQNGTTIGILNLELKNAGAAPSNFEVEADFVIRSIGVTGSLASNIDFTFNEDVDSKFEGTRSTTITTIDTTTASTLSVLASVNGTGSSIQSRLAYLRKQY